MTSKRIEIAGTQTRAPEQDLAVNTDHNPPQGLSAPRKPSRHTRLVPAQRCLHRVHQCAALWRVSRFQQQVNNTAAAKPEWNLRCIVEKRGIALDNRAFTYHPGSFAHDLRLKAATADRPSVFTVCADQQMRSRPAVR